MCGIAGQLSKVASAGLPRVVHRMTDRIRHRGPDDEGLAVLTGQRSIQLFSGESSPEEIRQGLPVFHEDIISEATACLGHRRFSILDPSPNGHQPWHDQESNLVLVFNGEVYNYIELRQELESLGYPCSRSDSDTEVVLAAYKAWGVDCFKRFNGFWALAILDVSENRLILSRDRFGKKPLYVWRSKDSLAFSSEVRSLAEAVPGGLSSLTLEEGAALLYLAYDRRNTIFGSFWKEVELFPAAHFSVISLDSLDEKRVCYYQLSANRRSESEIPFKRAVEELQHRFRHAVEMRLRSDVPYSANLSGGMDSSAIVAVAQDVLGEKKLSTNYIGYRNDTTLDESGYARAVAKFVGTDHSEIVLSDDEAWDSIDELVTSFEEPVHSQSFMTQWLGWKAIKETGCKVILHGAAGDELMAGYDHLAMLGMIDLVYKGNMFQALRGPLKPQAIRMLRFAKWFMGGKVYPQFSNKIRVAFGLDDRRELMPEHNSKFLAEHFSPDFVHRNQDAMRLINVSMVEANRSLPSRMLADYDQLRIPFWVNAMDKSMMSLPVEVRMPFLDYELVDFMFSLPISYHYRDGWTKYILRASLNGKLPDEVLWRKDKMGFSVPKKTWMEKNSSGIKRYLIENKPSLKPFLNVEAFTERENIDVNLLWRTYNFAKWNEEFNPRIT